MTVRRRSSASTKGWSTSRLAPMPFISSSGGTSSSVPGRTDVRSVRPSALIERTRSPLLVEDIRARGLLQDLEPAAELGGRRYVVPAPAAEPRGEVRPPGALLRA